MDNIEIYETQYRKQKRLRREKIVRLAWFIGGIALFVIFWGLAGNYDVWFANNF